MNKEDDHVMTVKGHPTNDLLSSYAFVTYNNKDSASEATEALNGATILGQQVKVNVARPKNGETFRFDPQLISFLILCSQMVVEVAAAMAAAVDVEVAAMEAATAMAEEVVMVEEGEGEDMVAVATQVGMLNTSLSHVTAPMIFFS